jgi:hypothetical protein
MRVLRLVVTVLVAWFAIAHVTASGPVGIYGIVEKVVFEPHETAPDRVQIWGAFAYVDGGAANDGVSEPRRGYMYFKIPTHMPAAPDVIRREWADLKAVAGTGQAVGFGSWLYTGRFGALQTHTSSEDPPHIFARAPQGGEAADMRIRPAVEPPANPAAYQTNAGIVKLSDRGSNANLVAKLRALIKQR